MWRGNVHQGETAGRGSRIKRPVFCRHGSIPVRFRGVRCRERIASIRARRTGNLRCKHRVLVAREITGEAFGLPMVRRGNHGGFVPMLDIHPDDGKTTATSDWLPGGDGLSE